MLFTDNQTIIYVIAAQYGAYKQRSNNIFFLWETNALEDYASGPKFKFNKPVLTNV